MGSPLRVLFVHGLESGPSGTKVRSLVAQGFDVRAQDMHMSLRRLDKRNSVARSLLWVPEVWVFGLALVVPLGVISWMPPLACVLWAFAVAWAALRFRAWGRQAMAISLKRCVQIQRRALATHQPDVVVGSSWGGAVTMQLLLDQTWAGPTVLLAPAHRLIQERIDEVGLPELLRRVSALRVPMVVFHDPDDDVVPCVGVGDLPGGTNVVWCPGAGHRLLPALEDGRIADGIRAVAARATEPGAPAR